ncbi:MAG TPA: helix-turn-helix transcriptional regulator [Clostridiales bacterium]|nr:helix-turn-helix transcriptional regulator [Clostridiales bacterium]
MINNATQMVFDFLKEGNFSVKEKHIFGKLGTCFTLECELHNINYWLYNFEDLFTISVSDMYFEKDFTQTFPSTDYISLYYYDSIDGYELPSLKPINCDCVSAFVGSDGFYTATYRGGVPVRGVGINITPQYYDTYIGEKLPGGFSRLKAAFLALNSQEGSPELLMVMKQIQNCRMTGDSARLYYESKVNEAVALVIDHAEKQHKTFSCTEFDKQRMVQLEQYIGLNYAGSICLPELAKVACMSISKLKYTFKMTYGCNISEYINEIRLTQAKKLLQENTISVSGIANKVGYKTTSAFTKMFKEKTGILPRDYRKSALGPR